MIPFILITNKVFLYSFLANKDLLLNYNSIVSENDNIFSENDLLILLNINSRHLFLNELL